MESAAGVGRGGPRRRAETLGRSAARGIDRDERTSGARPLGVSRENVYVTVQISLRGGSAGNFSGLDMNATQANLGYRVIPICTRGIGRVQKSGPVKKTIWFRFWLPRRESVSGIGTKHGLKVV